MKETSGCLRRGDAGAVDAGVDVDQDLQGLAGCARGFAESFDVLRMVDNTR